MAAQRPSPVLGIARASLTLAATLGLARVFAGPAWFVPVALAALAPLGVLSLAERRHVRGLVTVVAVVAVGWWLALLVDDPSTTLLTVPTHATFVTFFHDIAHAPHELRSAVVPVAVGGPALLLAVVAVYVTALVTEWLARRVETPMAAIGPSIALFVSITALGSGRWAPTTACYALAVLAYLLALHHEEVTARRTWFQARDDHRSRILAGGVAGAAVVVFAAVTLGPSVPGARGDAWLEYKSLGAGSKGSVLSAMPPILTLRDKLTQPDAQEVFTVKTADGRGWYWRAIALDHLAGDTWTVPPTGSRSASTLKKPAVLPNSTHSTQLFHLEGVDAYWLPAAYRPTHIDLKGAQVVPNSLTLYVSEGSMSDVTYTVDSEVAQPSRRDLEAVTRADLRDQRALADLPRNFPKRVRDLARRITAADRSPFAAAAALEAYFGPQNGFTYTLNTDLHSSGSALEKFLFDTKAGFCEQYASAFAAMARSIGLPTRVAVGYQRGTPDRHGVFHVTNHDAHAWPEVWLGDHIGWYPFEPTPGRTNPETNSGSSPGVPSSTDSTTPTTTPESAATGGSTPRTLPRVPSSLQVQGGSSSHRTSHDTARRVGIAIGVVLALALIGALVTLVVAIVAIWRRSWRRRHDRDPRSRVIGAWAEALERMEAAGIAPRPSATPVEFALRHAPAHGAGSAGPPLMELARLQTVAMFAPDPPTPEQATLAWRHVDVIDHAIRGAAPRLDRWRRRLRTAGLRPV
jgi:transglutaminase-like putative cysteine protease